MSDVLPEIDPNPETERPFGLVVGMVLGGAFVAIMTVVLIVVTVTSYTSGRERAQQGSELQPIEDPSSWCRETAADVSMPGSAHGSWDRIWIMGCERALD